MANQAPSSNLKERIGIVVSNKMTKTIVVQIRTKTRHEEYGKVMNAAQKFKVHDEKNEAKIGDRVRISESRPISKEKRWRLIEILGHASTSSDQDIKEVDAIASKKLAKKAAAETAAKASV